MAADLSGAVPAINAAFTGQALNLDALLSTPGASVRATGESGTDATGWSDARIDFAALKGVTAKLKLSAGQLTYNDIKINQANVQAIVAGGKLAATLPNFKLYGGAGTLSLNVDASGKVPTQRIRLSLVNFDAYPFLKDIAGFESIEGTGAISLDLTASGDSQRAMVSALSGPASFEFTDGAIRAEFSPLALSSAAAPECPAAHRFALSARRSVRRHRCHPAALGQFVGWGRVQRLEGALGMARFGPNRNYRRRHDPQRDPGLSPRRLQHA